MKIIGLGPVSIHDLFLFRLFGAIIYSEVLCGLSPTRFNGSSCSHIWICSSGFN